MTKMNVPEYKEGDLVTYVAGNEFGLNVSGMLYRFDPNYRAYILSDQDILNTGIKKNDIVKVLLNEGFLTLQEDAQ